MILQRLVEFADRIPDLPPPMYSLLSFKWQIELDEEGGFLGITPLSDGGKGNRGLEILSPNRKRSGTSPPPLLLADKVNYVLGFGEEKPSNSWHFQQFVNQVARCVEATGEPAVKAIAKFLEVQCSSPIECPADMQAGDMACFRIGSVRPIDLQSVKSFWVAQNASDAEASMQCVICGNTGPVDRVSPVAIKGLAGIGGQSSGMAVVSGNKEAFLSYGAEQSLIAPTCRSCGESYAHALNYMIGNERYRIFVGPMVFLFWTREEGGFTPVGLLSQPQEDDVKTLIASYRTGIPVTIGNIDDFYAVSLSASGGRVVIRDWLASTVSSVQTNLGRWFELQQIVDTDGSPGRPFGVYALAASLYLKPNDQMVANVPRSLVRCALYGGMLPDWIIAQAVRRNSAERAVTRNRVALIKAVLLSQMGEYKEDYMEKLDTSCTSPGYLCGRLLAELEAAQYHAVRPKATLVDRYYGAASASPATVYGNLLRGLQAHMAKLRKERPGVYHAIDGRLQDIMSTLGEFPKTLSLKEQALFALGYYHQKAANRAAAIAYVENNRSEEEK